MSEYPPSEFMARPAGVPSERLPSDEFRRFTQVSTEPPQARFVRAPGTTRGGDDVFVVRRSHVITLIVVVAAILLLVYVVWPFASDMLRRPDDETEAEDAEVQAVTPSRASMRGRSAPAAAPVIEEAADFGSEAEASADVEDDLFSDADSVAGGEGGGDGDDLFADVQDSDAEEGSGRADGGDDGDLFADAE